MANDGDEWQLGAVTDPAHDVVSDEPGRCVNANDVEQGDVDDGGEMYYRHRKVYIGKPLHKHNAPARRAQTHATNTHSTGAHNANMHNSMVAIWAHRARSRRAQSHKAQSHKVRSRRAWPHRRRHTR